MTTNPAEEHPSTNDGLHRIERDNANLEAYSRLLTMIRNNPEKLPAGGELSVAIAALDEAKLAGYQPESSVLASLDGDYLALVPKYSRPVVVNSRTLETHRLLDRSDVEIPMAWSSDSQSLAFAPSQAPGQILIYDVRQHVNRSTIGGRDREIVALQWSSDDTQIASLELVNRRLRKTPFGLLIALSGHPDFRNDLVLRVYGVTGKVSAPVQLKRDLTEQSSYEYWIEWR